MAVHNVVVPAPQQETASCCRSVTCDVSFLRSGSRCQRCASDLSNVTLRYLGSEQKGVVEVDIQLALSFLFVEMEDCRRRFRGAEL